VSAIIDGKSRINAAVSKPLGPITPQMPSTAMPFG